MKNIIFTIPVFLLFASCATKQASFVEILPYSEISDEYDSEYFAVLSSDTFRIDGETEHVQVVFSILVKESDLHKIYKNKKYLMYVSLFLQEEFNKYCKEVREDCKMALIREHKEYNESKDIIDFPVTKFIWWFNGHLVSILEDKSKVFLGEEISIKGFYIRHFGIAGGNQ